MAGLHLCKDRNCLGLRSHSSRALCAKVPVCGWTFWAAGVPNARMKGLSGSEEDGRSAIAATARRIVSAQQPARSQSKVAAVCILSYLSPQSIPMSKRSLGFYTLLSIVECILSA